MPIEYAARDCIPGSGQIVLLYKEGIPDQCHLEYTTSNPDYAATNAAKFGFTEFAILVDV